MPRIAFGFTLTNAEPAGRALADREVNRRPRSHTRHIPLSAYVMLRWRDTKLAVR